MTVPDAHDPAGDWERLERHLRLADGFWFGLVCSDDPRSTDELRARAEASLAEAHRTVRVVRPETPVALVDALDVPASALSRSAALVWIEAVRGGRAWDDAWERFLLRANERRSRWESNLRGGLILAGPLSLKTWARDAAPDLWSIRSYVAEPAPRREADVEQFRWRWDVPAEEPVPAPGGAEAAEQAADTLAVRGDPRAASAMLHAAQACAAAGQVGRALSWMARFEAAPAITSPWHVARTWDAISIAERLQGNVVNAYRHTERAIELSGDALRAGLERRVSFARELAEEMGDAELAMGWSRRAVELARERPEGIERDSALFQALWDHGKTCRRFRRFDAARDAMEEAVVVLDAISAVDGMAEGMEDVARVVWSDLGRTREAAGDLQGAIAACEHADALWERATSYSNQSMERHFDDLLRASRHWDELERSHERFQTAERALAFARRLREFMRDHPSAVARFVVAADWYARAAVLGGEPKAGADVLREALQCVERMRADPRPGGPDLAWWAGVEGRLTKTLDLIRRIAALSDKP